MQYLNIFKYLLVILALSSFVVCELEEVEDVERQRLTTVLTSYYLPLNYLTTDYNRLRTTFAANYFSPDFLRDYWTPDLITFAPLVPYSQIGQYSPTSSSDAATLSCVSLMLIALLILF